MFLDTTPTSEVLFWKIWRNIVIKNNIFQILLEQPTECYELTDFKLGNRIKFKYLKTMRGLIKRNQWYLLKDKLQHNNQVTFKNLQLEMDQLIGNCYDIEHIDLYELIYEKKNIQLKKLEISLLNKSINKNNLTAFKVFSKYYKFNQISINFLLGYYNNIYKDKTSNYQMIEYTINNFNFFEILADNHLTITFKSIERYPNDIQKLLYGYVENGSSLECIIQHILSQHKENINYIIPDIIYYMVESKFTDKDIASTFNNKTPFIQQSFHCRLESRGYYEKDKKKLFYQFGKAITEILSIPKKLNNNINGDQDCDQDDSQNCDGQEEECFIEPIFGFNSNPNTLIPRVKKPLQCFINGPKDDHVGVKYSNLKYKDLFLFGEVNKAIEMVKLLKISKFKDCLTNKQLRQFMKYYDLELITVYLNKVLDKIEDDKAKKLKIRELTNISKQIDRYDIEDYLSNIQTTIKKQPSIYIQSGSNIAIENGSKIVLESGTNIILQPGTKIVIN